MGTIRKRTLVVVATFMLLAVFALALDWSSRAEAQSSCTTGSGCLYVALNGLVSGFTGGAGKDLWGWMLGGSASAGTDNIAPELKSIQDTLTTIEDELGPNGPIVQQLPKLQCAEDSSWIAAGPATAINSWYTHYQNFLTDLQGGATIPLGEISSSNTDITTLYGWASGVIQGNANVAKDALTAMIELKEDTLTNSSSGTISDCIQAIGKSKLTTSSIDDRPYYTDNVEPLQNYLLNLNTQAMIVLTEAYHIYAYGECVTDNGAAACASSDSSDVVPNLCPTTNTSQNCLEPTTIYGRLGSHPSGQFLPFVHAQFRAAGAPYSTDEYLMVNGQDYLIARSIEQYNVAADPDNTAGCSTTEPGELTSAPGDVCGATVGIYNDPFTSVAYGHHGYGDSDYGTWTAAPNVGTFGTILQVEYNQSSTAGSAFTDPYLCTMTLNPQAGDKSKCTQAPSGNGKLANGGAGLILGQQIIVFNELASNSFTESFGTGPQILFLDAGIERGTVAQPNTAGTWYLKEVGGTGCGPASGSVFMERPDWWLEEIDPNWYVAEICLNSDKPSGWSQAPPYDPAHTYAQYRWPALEWTQLTCSNGKPPTDPSNLNPAGVPSLCGKDFEAWFNALVPPVWATTPRGKIAGTTGLVTNPFGSQFGTCWPPQTLPVLAIGDYTLLWQTDGNLVLYNGEWVGANSVWATDTNGTGQLLCWQDDGNLAIYGASNNTLWSSHTADIEQGGAGGQ
jgi:hypothetical protein